MSFRCLCFVRKVVIWGFLSLTLTLKKPTGLMSFAKRCGVAIATRWTLVIFAACKEAMALGVGSDPPSTPWKFTWNPTVRELWFRWFSFSKQVIVGFHASLFWGVYNSGKFWWIDDSWDSLLITQKDQYCVNHYTLEKLTNGYPEWWTCKRYCTSFQYTYPLWNWHSS